MSDARRKAGAWRAEVGLPGDQPIPAEAVLEACQAATGFRRHFLPPDDPLLAGAQAVLNLELGAILQDESLPLPCQRFDAAHEFAHVRLHGGTCHCATDDLSPLGAGESPVQAKVDGYSPRQRRESEANEFAAEMLLPGALARRLFLDDNKGSGEIADELGLPHAVVQAQLMNAVLLPPLPPDAPASVPTPATPPEPLDPSQQAAAEAECGPLLLGAGPGTGKTKTLVGRCLYLTGSRGVPAEKILALTFSRRAAEEMRERLRRAGVGGVGAGPWVGTFHGFGLEILRRFGDRLGLPTEMRLLDTLDAVTLLENHLSDLQLDALDNLYDPAMHLRGILGQISRAKDELCPPGRYAELCRAMTARAREAHTEFAARPGKKRKADEDAVARLGEQARRAGEVARAYGVYEALLREHGFLDFADLICRAAALLEEHADVRMTLQAEYPHVLADEYQDVNRACARLVRLLAGDEARGLWAVGDHRQSIYRFRGASPANVAAFGRDYPGGRRLELGVNYRSREPIVSLFGVAAGGMEPVPLPEGQAPGWHPHRGTDESPPCPAVTLAVAPDEEGQADGIARAIDGLRAAGRPFREQTILCRTHGQAESLAALLAARNIPALYAGALLERPEVKDLLCLLSLFADKNGLGLIRVAALPEYAVPQAETLALIARIQFDGTPLLETLRDDALPPGLRRLGAQLAELETMADDPAGLLRHYLFGLSDYLRHLGAGAAQPLARTQRLLAISQLLSLAGDHDRRLVVPGGMGGPPNRVRDFLAHLRRMTSAGETLRGELPPEADALDGVRLLTAHAAKGLEYPVVFLPNLGDGQFPARGRADGIPTPPGLADEAGQELGEEECLFFVALSRARDTLFLSRSETKGADRAVKPSPLLALTQSWFVARGIGETVWPSGRAGGESGADDSPGGPGDGLPTYSASDLETYGRCPRQYYYERVLGLPGAFRLSAYPQFHSCVRQTLQWLEDERLADRAADAEIAETKLDELWAESGPVGHLHEAKYKDSARQMLRASLGMDTGDGGRPEKTTLQATLGCCRVRVRPDVVRLGSDGTLVVSRHLTGRPGDDDKNDRKLALYRRAAEETHPDRPLRLELRYLADGAVVPVEPPESDYKARLESDRVAKYDRAARGIQLGLFPAVPSDECQRCGHALVCPV